MGQTPLYVVTAAAGGGVGGVARTVVQMLLEGGQRVRATVHREDERSRQLRELGAEVIAGDLTDPRHAAEVLDGSNRVFFSMGVSERYLEATTVWALAARSTPGTEVVVNMSQMTVSQMTATSTAESRQQRLHFLAEHVLDWSGVPVVHMRPTVFLENPLFNEIVAPGLRERGVLALPFGTGRTSPVAADDVAASVTAVLLAPSTHTGPVYELTGPQSMALPQLADAFGRGLEQPVAAEPLTLEAWAAQLEAVGLDAHVQQHLATMARLHRENRYDRCTDEVQTLTGRPATPVDVWVRQHRDEFQSDPQAPRQVPK
ncbi:NmrA family NAD(P)-binding protein [Streptomyces adustus]